MFNIPVVYVEHKVTIYA